MRLHAARFVLVALGVAGATAAARGGPKDRRGAPAEAARSAAV